MVKPERGDEPPHIDPRGTTGGDRRASPRVTVLIRPGKLIADGREFLCVVRDVSKGGVKVRLFHPLPDHRVLRIEFDNGEQHALQMVWQSNYMAGCRFVDDVDVERLIKVHESRYPRRQPRLHIERMAVLCASSLRTPIMLRDISPRGASFECNDWLMIDELIRIESEALPTLHAKVRWRRPPHYGIVFEQTFGLEELAQLCADLCPREPSERCGHVSGL